MKIILHLPSATAAKEGDDDDDGGDADEDVGGGVVDVEVKSINVVSCHIFRLCNNCNLSHNMSSSCSRLMSFIYLTYNYQKYKSVKLGN